MKREIMFTLVLYVWTKQIFNVDWHFFLICAQVSIYVKHSQGYYIGKVNTL